MPRIESRLSQICRNEIGSGYRELDLRTAGLSGCCPSFPLVAFHSSFIRESSAALTSFCFPLHFLWGQGAPALGLLFAFSFSSHLSPPHPSPCFPWFQKGVDLGCGCVLGVSARLLCPASCIRKAATQGQPKPSLPFCHQGAG